jgi:predicted dienelactone hydrolase
MRRATSVVLTILLFTSVINSLGCSGGNSMVQPAPVISVSVAAGSANVPAGGTASFTATVTNDTSSRGVTWSVSCSAAQCGTVSPTSTMSGNSTTYSAPTTPPPSDMTITVKATSIADTSKSNSATITFSAVTVSVSLTSASVQAGNSLDISASVNNDLSGQGVSWTISPASGVGTLNNANNSGVTYTAPATSPSSDASVTLTATSLFDTTKSATVKITVPFVTIAVTPLSASIEATATVPNLTATVAHDPSNKGVSWTVSCATPPCGGVSPGSSLSGAAVVYTAPPTPPSSDNPVTLTATSVADPAATTSITITVLAISVAVTASTGTVSFADTVPNIVATVSNDPAGKGVTWALQPCGAAQCGSISSQATPTGGAISYTAPSSPVASNLPVTIVATAVSDATKSNSVGITVLAITVTISPPSAIIPVGSTTQLNATPFTATVANDSSNGGVTWTLIQGAPPTPCSSTCGSIDSSTSPAIYAAPANVPPNPSVSVTATSVTDTTKTTSVTVALVQGTVKIIPSGLSFGTLKIQPRQPLPKRTLTVQLTNTGASALNITGQTIASGPYSVTAPCAASLTSGTTCNLGVTFAPSITGTFNTTLSVADNDVTSPQQAPLTGKACAGFRCFGAAIQQALVTDRIVVAPAPSGSNKIGTRTLHLVDTNRADPYLANGQPRELLVRFWYPADLVRGCNPASYSSPGVWNYMAQLVQVKPPHVKTNSCQDAPIAAGSHPVVVFTHGYTGTLTDYTFLFEDLASRGYVVASVGHTFESTAVEFPDGRLFKSVVGSHLERKLQLNEASTTFAVAARLSDLKFVMNELGRLNGPSKTPFTGALDLSRVAVAGHSLGGMTALLSMELDSRYRAAITLDGVMPSSWLSATQKPVMLLVSGSDWDENTCHLWSRLHGPRFAVNLKNSEHLTPSDAIWLTDGAIKTSGGMDKTVSAVRDYMAAFLDSNMNGKSGTREGLLTSASPDYPDVELVTGTQNSCTGVQNNLPK